MDLKELSKMDLGSLLKGGGQKKSPDLRLSAALGLDWGADQLRAVRLKAAKDKIEVVAADCFPLPEEGTLATTILPPGFRSHYAALSIRPDEFNVRVFSHTEEKAFDLQKVLRENVGAGDEDRVSGLVLKEAIPSAGSNQRNDRMDKSRHHLLLSFVSLILLGGGGLGCQALDTEANRLTDFYGF